MVMDAVAFDTRSSARCPEVVSHDTTESPWTVDSDEDLILSEVHIGKAPSNAPSCTTHFSFSCPRSQISYLNARSKLCQDSRPSSQLLGQSESDYTPVSNCLPLDAEGDVIVERRRQPADSDSSCASCGHCHRIVIHHAMATSLQHVGKQVPMLDAILVRF